MNFDWSEYLELSRTLVSNTPNSQAALRCAISRAYYAAYCKTRNHLRDNDAVPLFLGLRGGDHQEVIDALRNSGERERVRLARERQRLRGDRVLADYYDDSGQLGATLGQMYRKAQQTILNAERILTALTTLPPPTP